MRRHCILVLTLAAVAALSVACGGSPAAQPPTSGSPAATPQAGGPTSAPGAAQPYPVVTPAATAAPPATAATATPAAPYPVVKDGLALMNERCTVCHDAAHIQAAKKSRAEWESTVATEKAKGAKLTDMETTLLVDFLAATYK
ncbi:MAG: hypothetical protein Q7U96_01040 [Chloroflexota bacterium]|nr:hypothetical protein [Chloroflexota bacterium]